MTTLISEASNIEVSNTLVPRLAPTVIRRREPEAAGLALRYRDQVERTLAEYRHALARPVPLVIRTIDRARWARGAAARAIQQFAFHADL